MLDTYPQHQNIIDSSWSEKDHEDAVEWLAQLEQVIRTKDSAYIAYRALEIGLGARPDKDGKEFFSSSAFQNAIFDILEKRKCLDVVEHHLSAILDHGLSVFFEDSPTEYVQSDKKDDGVEIVAVRIALWDVRQRIAELHSREKSKQGDEYPLELSISRHDAEQLAGGPDSLAAFCVAHSDGTAMLSGRLYGISLQWTQKDGVSSFILSCKPGDSVYLDELCTRLAQGERGFFEEESTQMTKQGGVAIELFQKVLDAKNESAQGDALGTFADAVRNILFINIADRSRCKEKIPGDILLRYFKEGQGYIFSDTYLGSVIFSRMAPSDLQSPWQLAYLKSEDPRRNDDYSKEFIEHFGRQLISLEQPITMSQTMSSVWLFENRTKAFHNEVMLRRWREPLQERIGYTADEEVMARELLALPFDDQAPWLRKRYIDGNISLDRIAADLMILHADGAKKGFELTDGEKNSIYRKQIESRLRRITSDREQASTTIIALLEFVGVGVRKELRAYLLDLVKDKTRKIMIGGTGYNRGAVERLINQL